MYNSEAGANKGDGLKKGGASLKKILIIEDEPNIRELILYNVKQNSYEGVWAEDGPSGLEAARKEQPDLILLDIMLPGMDGYDICKTLRSEGNKVPIIMLTAKSDEIDKVLGLEFGADDYIAKPFGVRELMARIKAVLRRYEITQNQEGIPPLKEQDKGKNSLEQHTDSLIEIGDLTIDQDRHEVKIAGQNIELTLKEFDLLTMLAQNRGRVMSREQLLDQVWGFDYAGETRTVDVHVRYLRKKLGDDDKDGKYIKTVRGIGYKIQ